MIIVSVETPKLGVSTFNLVVFSYLNIYNPTLYIYYVEAFYLIIALVFADIIK